ncbi:hypothetical protein [Agrobacterium larrymoorei]|uniref:Uncharacterized protein n=1 Tax=Agrobacterium larrymoorei TaxID=160699 RepID=A0AAF0HA81_9HYPH|nr:hypothetical protein [Agrobacterium larrymoorei]WHA40566.1 hypothetical protein CFBP5477_012150 [Agrobacterium larrymoorei]
MSSLKCLNGKGGQAFGKGLGEGCCAAWASLRREKKVRTVRLPHQAQAVEADMLIELDVDKSDTVFRTALIGGVAVENSHNVLSAHEGAPADLSRQVVVVVFEGGFDVARC